MASIVRRLTMSSQSKPAPGEIDLSTVMKKGVLKKKGHVRRNWLGRFFVLCADGLYYYKDEAAAVGDSRKPLGHVLMFGCTVSEDMFQRHENVFSIFTADGKDYHLQASSSENMHEWITAIESAREKAVAHRSTPARSKSDAGDLRRKKLTHSHSLPDSSVGSAPKPVDSANGAGKDS